MEVVKVKDIREVLEGDEWNKDDSIHDYAVALVEWVINKRKVTIPDDTPMQY